MLDVLFSTYEMINAVVPCSMRLSITFLPVNNNKLFRSSLFSESQYFIAMTTVVLRLSH